MSIKPACSPDTLNSTPSRLLCSSGWQKSMEAAPGSPDSNPWSSDAPSSPAKPVSSSSSNPSPPPNPRVILIGDKTAHMPGPTELVQARTAATTAAGAMRPCNSANSSADCNESSPLSAETPSCDSDLPVSIGQ